MSAHYETIVIGLGAAGATAAATLAQAGRRVLALEAQGRIGGRVHTVPFGDGFVELGAEWVHGNDPSRVADAADKNNIILIPQDLDLVVYHSNGVKPDERFQELFNELVEYAFVASSASTVKPLPLGKHTTALIMEYIKTEKPELLHNNEFIMQLLEFLNQLTNNYNASNDWDDVDSCSNYQEIEGHQHLSWHRYGYKTYFDITLNRDVGFPTLDIKLNTEVTQIEWSENPHQKVTVSCKGGMKYSANTVIVTVSLGVLKATHTTLFKPKLPNQKINAIEKIAMGVMDKIDLAFKDIWWPLDAVFFGFLWKEENRKDVAKEDYWTTKIFAASRPMGSRNVLTLWTSGEIGKLVETLPVDEVKSKCRQLLQRFMGAGITIPEPIAIERSTWSTNPYTRGSYSFDHISATWHPKLRADLAAPLKDSAGKPLILFAGEATHLNHFSTVHGAAETGYKAAMEAMPKVNSKF